MNKLFVLYFFCLLVPSMYYFRWTNDDDDDENFHSLILFLFWWCQVYYGSVIEVPSDDSCFLSLTCCFFFLSLSHCIFLSFIEARTQLANKSASSERTSPYNSFDHTHVVIFLSLSFISSSSSHWSRSLSHQLLLHASPSRW
jgi:hypothetical protein